MFFDIRHLEWYKSAFYITTTYFRCDGRCTGVASMLHSRLQSQYAADSSAETHHDHRGGCADEVGILGMRQIGHLQPEIWPLRFKPVQNRCADPSSRFRTTYFLHAKDGIITN